MAPTTVLRVFGPWLIAGAFAAPVLAQSVKPKPRGVQLPALVKQSAAAVQTVTKPYEKDSQPHPDRAYRVDKMRPGNWGDTRVLESVAGHAVIYAKQRYGISEMVSDADYQRASREMYQYLGWKYGNPSLVAAQWLSAGYEHFDSFAAEAAAALMGMELPGPGPQLTLPRELSTWLKTQADSMAKDPQYDPCTGGRSAETSGAAGAAAPSAAGAAAGSAIDALVGASCNMLTRLAADAARLATERISISQQAFDVQRNFNIGDTGAEFMIYLRRNPTHSLRPALRPVLIRGIGEGGSQ